MFEKYIWTEKYRPQSLNDVVLPDKTRKLLQTYIQDKQSQHMLFAGPPGVGKSTTAKVIVKELDADYLYINASDETGIDVIRTKVIGFAETRSLSGNIKIVILDECDGLSSVAGSTGRTSAQQALRNVIEEYSDTTRFILAANYPAKIIDALHSRCVRVDFTPPVTECVKFCVNILKNEGVKVSDEQKSKIPDLLRAKYPDMRKMINALQSCTFDGELNISDESDGKLVASKVYKLIQSPKTKRSCYNVRKYTIENESEFGDYHSLMRNIFDVVFDDDTLSEDIKANSMLVITEAMYKHNQVMDQEVNFFACVLQLKEIFS